MGRGVFALEHRAVRFRRVAVTNKFLKFMLRHWSPTVLWQFDNIC